MKNILYKIIGIFIIPLLFMLISSQINIPKKLVIPCCILLLIATIIYAFYDVKIFRLTKKTKYILESMPIINTLGRDNDFVRINEFVANNEKNIMLIEGESGLGKTSIISSYINKAKKLKQFDVVIWQPLIDLPTMREVVNNWLNIYMDNIPDLGLNARLDAFLRKARENKHKRIMIVFDNCESILQSDKGQISLPDDFLTLISRLAIYQECKIKIVITSSVDLNNILLPNIIPDVLKISRLSNHILSQIVYERTSISINADNLKAAHGNPSAALLLAEIATADASIFREFSQTQLSSFAILIDKRMQLLNDKQRKLIELLSIVRFPMSISEIQDLWKMLPQHSSVNQTEIIDLQRAFLIENVSESKYLINPIVASVFNTQIIDGLSKIIALQDIENVDIINQLPLDYAIWPKTARNNVLRNVFPSIVKTLLKSYQLDIYEIGKDLINILQNIASVTEIEFMPSNIVSFLLFCGIEFKDVIFPPLTLIGVDFSQIHMFGTDLSDVKIIDCQFADRIGSAYTVQFMKEDSLIVGLASGAIELRKTSNLLRTVRIETHSQPVRAVCYSEKNRKIVSGGEDGRVVIYDENLSELKSIELHTQWIWQIIEISDNYVLTVACGGYIGLIDLRSNNVCAKYPVPSQRIWKAAKFEQRLYLASEDGILWKCMLSDILALRKPKWEIAANIQEPIKACCTCDKKVIFGCRDGKLYWINDQDEYNLLASEGSCIRDICNIKGSNKVITVGDSGIANIYDVTKQKMLGELQVQSSRTWAIDTLSNGIAVTVGDDRTVHLWNTTENISLRKSCGNGQSLRCVDIYQGNNIFACADDFLRIQDKDIIIPWKTLRVRKRILGLVSLNNDRWACTFEDGVVWLGDSKGIIRKIDAHTSAIESIARSIDGKLFATGGEDRVIKIYNSEGEEQISPRPLHNSRIWSLAFSPDKKKLASAGGDFIVAIWDIKTGDILGNCLGHNNLVLSLCWLDNSTFVSAGTDGTIRLWNINTYNYLNVKTIPCLIRGLATDGNGVVYGVGRNSNTEPGWVIIKWDTQSDELKLKETKITGGSARTVLYANNKVYLGGDLPFWFEINIDTLDIINKIRIPGIYNGMKIDPNKSQGVDIDCLTLLGTEVLGRKVDL